MFESALLESSPPRLSVLRRIHYLSSALAGTLLLAVSMSQLPRLLLLGDRALVIAAATLGVAAGAYSLMLCYVWVDSRRQRWHEWPWFLLTLALNLLGFLIYLVCSARKSGDWKRASLPLAYVAESTMVGVLILVPLIYTQALPRELLFGPVHIAPPPGPPRVRHVAQPVGPAPHRIVDLTLAPPSIPVGVQRIVDRPEPATPAGGQEIGVIGMPSGGPLSGPGPWVLGGLPSPGQMPPPPPMHAAPKQRMIRVGGKVIAAQALYQPQPTYPPLARMARVQGTVVLQAIIGTDGTVKDLKVLSGPGLLVSAALDTVKTWRYQPTLLNSEPVEVLTEINVIFRLDE